MKYLLLMLAMALVSYADDSNTLAEAILKQGVSGQSIQQCIDADYSYLAEGIQQLLIKSEGSPRFNSFMDMAESLPRGPQILEEMYTRLLITIDNPENRIRVFQSMTAIQGKEALPFIEAELAQTTDAGRDALLMLIGRLADATAVNILQHWMQQDKTLAAGVTALGLTGQREAIPILINAMRASGSREIRRQAADSLKHITGYDFGPRHNVWTAWWEKQGGHFAVRRLVLDFRILDKIADNQPVAPEIVSEFFKQTLKGLNQKVPEPIPANKYMPKILTQPRAWRGVRFSVEGKINRIEHIDTMMLLYLQSPAYTHIQLIIPSEALPAINDWIHADAVFYKLEALKEPRQSVIVFFGKPVFGEKSVNSGGIVRELLHDNPEVRNTVRETIRQLGPQGLQILETAIINEGDPGVKAAALLLAFELYPDRIIPLAEQCLINEDPLLRATATMVMEEILDNPVEMHGNASP